MTKQCVVCKKAYPDNFPACPHCAAAQQKTGPGDVFAEDLELSPAPRAPGSSPLEDEPIALWPEENIELDAATLESLQGPSSGGSDVDLATLFNKEELPPPFTPGVAPPLGAPSASHPEERSGTQRGLGGMEGSASPLLSQGMTEPAPTKGDPKFAKKTMLAAEAEQAAELAKGGDPKKTKVAAGGTPKTMLAEAAERAASLKIEGDPKKTQMAAQSVQPTKLMAGATPKTMLATAEEQEAALKQSPTDPKATKLAGGAAKVTMLAQPEAQEAKKTKIASGAAPTTTLAPPGEMEADAQLLADKSTRLAAPPGPMTNLAPIEEMEALAREGASPKATKLAAGAAPLTKLAKPEEQDLLNLPDAAPEMGTPDIGVSSVDLGSVERMQAEMAETEALEPIEELRAPAEKPRKSRLLLGAFLGTVVGGAACIGLIVTDTVTSRQLKSLLGMYVPPTSGPVDAGISTGLAAARNYLDTGDFDKAVKALGNEEDPSGDVLSTLGQARWLNHLKQQKMAGQAPKKDDNDVVQAQKDLTAAKNAEGTFWLGHIQELVEGPAAARKTYEEGINKFKDNPAHQKLFESALNRLDAVGEEKAPGAWLPLPEEQWLLFFTGLQNPAAEPAASADEAGYHFWRAAKLAKEHKYSEAIEALARARAAHEARRFARLRKAQNPASDPTEEIFLRSADELLNYWKFREAIEKQGFKDLDSLLIVAKNKDAVKTLADIVKLLKEADPDLKDDLAKSLQAILESKKKTDDQMKEIVKALTDAKFLGGEQKDVLKAFMDLFKKSEADAVAVADSTKLLMPKYVNDDQKSMPKGVEKLLEDKKTTDEMLKALEEVDGTLQGIVKMLADAEGKYLNPKTDTKKDGPVILKSVQQVVRDAYAPSVTALGKIAREVSGAGRDAAGQLGKNLDLSARVAANEVALARYQTMLMQSRPPHRMLDLWLPLLQDRERKDLADRAALDARRVTGDKGAAAAVKAQALCVEGLALRNQSKFPEARKSLEAALAGAGKSEWRPYGQQGLSELTDPAVYYLPQADNLRALGRADAAVALLTSGLGAFPADTREGGQLLALRSLVNIETARGRAKGKLNPADPLMAAAGKDAQAALAAGAVAEGNFAAGRLAEELGNYTQAHKNFRQALEASRDGDPRASSRYRVALGRVLLKLHDRKPDEAAAGEKMGLLSEPIDTIAPASKPTIAYSPLSEAVVALLLMAGADEDEPRPTPELDEAIRLAEEAIKAGNYEGHLVKALALGKKGRWNDAVLEYALGLERLNRSEYVNDLRYLIDNHPSFKIPDGLQPPDPLLAEKHYAAGMRNYWARRYGAAEREFYDAVRYHDQDARYMYFLGLSRLAQGKNSFAYESFKRAGLLEQQNKPASAAISATLERVQGTDRQVLNQFRP